jgi:hypothetical protein
VGMSTSCRSIGGWLTRKTIVPAHALLQARSRLGNTRRSCTVESITYEGTYCSHPGALIAGPTITERSKRAPHKKSRASGYLIST